MAAGRAAGLVILGAAVTTIFIVVILVGSATEVMVIVAVPLTVAVYVAPVEVTLVNEPTPVSVIVAPLFVLSLTVTEMLKDCPMSSACAPFGDVIDMTMGFVLLQPIDTNNNARRENNMSFRMIFL